MDVLTVGSAGSVDEVCEALEREFAPLRAEGYPLHLEVKQRGTFRFVHCRLGGARAFSPEVSRLWRQYAANAVAHVVVDCREPGLVRRIARVHYGDFRPADLETICQYACRALAAGEGPAERRDRVRQEAIRYFERHSELVVEGFVTFRLKAYVQELEAAVDRAVDDLLMEREYDEFVSLLRYFVDLQPARVGEVHVFYRGEGVFQLVDAHHRSIERPRLDNFPAEGVGDVNGDDLLVSTLVTLAPSRLVLHRPQALAADTLQTLQAVFHTRLKLCEGCRRCQAACGPAFTGHS